MERKEVIITTSYRGVYHGFIVWKRGQECILEDARMVIRWGTTNGVDQLAATGPTEASKIGSMVGSVRLFGITSIATVSSGASSAWAAR